MEKDNKILVRNFIEKVINTGNAELVPNFVSHDYKEVFDGKTYESGIEGAKEHIKGVRKTYPDLKMDIEMQIAEGEWVATSYTMTGTHSGEWMGIKPTFRKITVTGVNLDRVDGGKITEHGGAANLLTALIDIGAVKIAE